MGEVLSADFKNKKYLGKLQEKPEALSLETPPEVLLTIYESSLGFNPFVAPESDPA